MNRFAEIKELLKDKGVELIAVSKTHPAERILEIYAQGQRAFGENRVQELLDKQAVLPSDVEWHLIGHLQTNKVRFIVPFIRLIHSVDSLRLLQEIEKQAGKIDRRVDCLLQFHIAREETKFGLTEEEAHTLLNRLMSEPLHHARICGVMGMATNTEDVGQIRTEFQELCRIFEVLREKYFSDQPYFKELSMGMSSDWQEAVAAGSTMVRIGSLVFGPR